MASGFLTRSNTRTAVDSNILFDLISDEESRSEAALQSLAESALLGPVVICPVVYAELGVAMPEPVTLAQFLDDLGIRLDGFLPGALQRAGVAWAIYLRRGRRQLACPRCGFRFDLACPNCQSRIVWRQHLISDFLIGAHAVTQTSALITRDRGYFRTYFPELRLIAPSAVAP